MCEYCDKELLDNDEQKAIMREKIDAGFFGRIDLMVDIYFDRKGRSVLSAGWLGEGTNSFFHDSPISYCPMCGRKLEAEPCAGSDDY